MIIIRNKQEGRLLKVTVRPNNLERKQRGREERKLNM